MVHADASATERAARRHRRDQDRTAGGVGGQRARLSRALLQRQHLDRELELGEPAAGHSAPAGDRDRPSDGGPGRRAGRALDPGHGADGGHAMVGGTKKSERGVALLVTMMALALMTM